MVSPGDGGDGGPNGSSYSAVSAPIQYVRWLQFQNTQWENVALWGKEKCCASVTLCHDVLDVLQKELIFVETRIELEHRTVLRGEPG